MKETIGARISRKKQEKKEKENITVESLLNEGKGEEAIKLLQSAQPNQIITLNNSRITKNITELKALLSCPSLTALDINLRDFNNIFPLLTDILKKNNNILSLDLTGNKIDEKGAALPNNYR